MSERSYHRATSSSPIFTSRSPVKKDTTQSMFIILVYLPVFVCGAFTFQSLYVVRLPSSLCMWCVYLPVFVCGAFTFQSLYVVRLPSSLCMWCIYLPVFVCGAFTFQSLYVVRLTTSMSASDTMGCSSHSRQHWAELGFRMLASGPTGHSWASTKTPN